MPGQIQFHVVVDGDGWGGGKRKNRQNAVALAAYYIFTDICVMSNEVETL